MQHEKISRIPWDKQPSCLHSFASFSEFLSNETYLFLRTHNEEGKFSFRKNESNFENISRATIEFLSTVLTFNRIKEFKDTFLTIDREPLIAPVHAYEYLGRDNNDYTFRLTDNGSNLMSIITSIVLNRKTNIEVDFGFRQTNKVTRNASADLHRLSFPTKFHGKVVPGKAYVIFDDHIKTGSTVANLAGHIFSHGGNVLGYSALSINPIVNFFKQTQETRDALRQHPAFETVSKHWALKFGYEAETLTEMEAKILIELMDNHDHRLIQHISDYQKAPVKPVYPKPSWWNEKIEQPQINSLTSLGINGRIIILPTIKVE